MGNGATPPLEGLLAGLRLALGTGDAGEERAALAGVVDWASVSRLVLHHRVGTLFLAGLGSAAVAVPDAAAARALSRQRRRELVRGMRQFAAMKRVTAALDTAGIPSLVLKGLPLGQRVYGGPFAKSSIDLDLLVPEDGFSAAAGILRELGWRRTVPDFRETPARMRWYDAVQKEHVFAGHGSRVELHRRLLSNPFLFDPPFEALYSRAQSVELAPDRFRTLGDADQLLYLGCHGSCHYWQRLKWLCDFAALLRVMGDEGLERAATAGRRGGIETAVGAGLWLCRDYLHIKPRAGAAGALSRRRWRPDGHRPVAARLDAARRVAPTRPEDGDAGRPIRDRDGLPVPPPRGEGIADPLSGLRPARPSRPPVLAVRPAVAAPGCATAQAWAAADAAARHGGRPRWSEDPGTPFNPTRWRERFEERPDDGRGRWLPSPESGRALLASPTLGLAPTIESGFPGRARHGGRN